MRNNKNGFLVAFEGVDGCGKTTLIQACEQRLRVMYDDIVITKQPGGSSLGSVLYTSVGEQSTKITPMTEFLLFAADRAQHMHDVIIPAKNRGALILCDRMGDSSLVYQGYAKSVDIAFIQQVHAHIIGTNKADLTIFCLISAKEASMRRARRKNNDQFDRRDDTFFDVICRGYQELYAESRDDVLVVDALLPINQLVGLVIDRIQQRLGHI